jgi:nucleoporin NUP82
VDALNVFLQYKANQLLAEKPMKETGDVFRDAHIRQLAAQRRFADILASQIIAQKSSGTGMRSDGTGHTYTITLPNSKYLNDSKPLRRQGPFLFKPAPEELALSPETGPNVEGVASDIRVLPGTGARSAASGRGDDDDEALQSISAGSGVGVVAIAWKDGRVDICLEVAKVEALWVEEDLVSPRVCTFS